VPATRSGVPGARPAVVRQYLTRQYLTRQGVLTGRHVVASRPMVARLASPQRRTMHTAEVSGLLRPGARAIADPDRAGSQQAPQLAGAGQIRAVTGTQREVLRLAGQVTARMAGDGGLRLRASRCLVAGRGRGARESVIGIWPRDRLAGIQAGSADTVSELGQLMTAALTDRREMLGVPGQAERDLERLAGPVPARDGGHGQHRAIYAA
jgi:hypothetical protein